MPLPTRAEIRPVLLSTLASLGGRARRSELYPVITARFPGIEAADLAVRVKNGRMSIWENRVSWARKDLVAAGLLDPTERGVWKLTDAGLAAANAGNTTFEPALDVPDPEEDPFPEVASVSLGASDLLIRLEAAALDSIHPNEFERVVAEVFLALGFDAEVVGGAGETDVVLTAPLGVNGYSVVVDAKSTARGRVAESQINWLSIRGHRDARRAEYACVVGTDFSGGNLPARAREFGISLLTVRQLQALLEHHRRQPFALTELRALFESGSDTDSLDAVVGGAQRRQRMSMIIARVLELFDTFNRMRPDVALGQPETLAALLLTQGMTDVVVDEVRRAVDVLELTGVLVRHPDRGFTSVATPDVSQALLRASLDGCRD